MFDDNERFLNMMRVLSDLNRFVILQILGDCRICSCSILSHMDISQPTLSHHRSVLVDAGLVRRAPTGRWYGYNVDRDAPGFVESYISGMAGPWA